MDAVRVRPTATHARSLRVDHPEALPPSVSVRRGTNPPTTIVMSSRDKQLQEWARAFLDLLSSGVTITDAADSSHALGIHWFADIKEYSSIGSLVERAKDYGPQNPSDPRAVEQVVRMSLDRISRHPLLSSADVVAAIPSTRRKSLDLPATVAREISDALGMNLSRIISSNPIQQKGKPDSDLSSAQSLSAMMISDNGVPRQASGVGR